MKKTFVDVMLELPVDATLRDFLTTHSLPVPDGFAWDDTPETSQFLVEAVKVWPDIAARDRMTATFATWPRMSRYWRTCMGAMASMGMCPNTRSRLLTGQRPADVLKIKRTDIRDGALWIVQNKTGARLGIEITGELAAVIERINQRPRKAISTFLIQDENGQPLSQGALRSRFDKARTLAKVDFQFRDIRAKAATDTGDLAHSQKLLAHKNREMTEHYVKSRIGERVKPLR